MNVSHGFLNRPRKARVASAILLFSLSATATFLAMSRQARATVRHYVLETPACMRRVTINSKPCGAWVYIDETQVGQTPINFPMPQGGYQLTLAAPGHRIYAQRILVQDAPLTIEANLVPDK